jgi:PKD domain
VLFSNSSIGAKSYLWDFKDGTKSTEKEPTHTFKRSANVSLTIYGDNGCTDSSTVGVTISSNCIKPTPDFTFTDGQLVPATIKFLNTSTNSNNNFKWYILDGLDTIFRSTEVSLQYDFTLATTYQVILIANNSCGTSSITKNITLKTITFSKIYPSNITPNDDKLDVGNSVKMTSNGSGNYFILGNTVSRTTVQIFSRLYLITADKNGNFVSESKPTFTQGNFEVGSFVTEERRFSGGLGLVLFGSTNSQAMSIFWIPSTSSINDGSRSTTMVSCNYVESLPNSQYAVCGKNTTGQIYLAKTNGNLVESKKWVSTTLGEAVCIKSTKDNGFIACAVSNNSFNLVKTDVDLNTSWQNTYSTTSGGVVKSVVQNSKTNEYIACGSIGTDMYFLTVNSLGSVITDKTLRYKSSDLKIKNIMLNGSIAANCIRETRDGGFIVGGSTSSTGLVGGGAILMKINAAFNTILWVKNFGTLKGEINFVEEHTDGGFLLTGKTTTNPLLPGQSNVLFIKTDKDGNIQ